MYQDQPADQLNKALNYARKIQATEPALAKTIREKAWREFRAALAAEK